MRWFLEGRDLELLDDDTKVVWASSPAPLPFVKPRDFVTVVNVRRLEDGSIVVVNRGYRHPAAPVRYVVVVAVVLSGGGGGCEHDGFCQRLWWLLLLAVLVLVPLLSLTHRSLRC